MRPGGNEFQFPNLPTAAGKATAVAGKTTAVSAKATAVSATTPTMSATTPTVPATTPAVSATTTATGVGCDGDKGNDEEQHRGNAHAGLQRRHRIKLANFDPATGDGAENGCTNLRAFDADMTQSLVVVS